MLRSPAFRSALAFLLVWIAPLVSADDSGYHKPSAALAAIVDAPLAPQAVISPNRALLLLLDRPEAPPIAELATPELRLAGLRINPATHGPSRSAHYTGLLFKRIVAGGEQRVTGLPPNPRIADYAWSRDSRTLALTLVSDTGIALWVVDCDNGRARPLGSDALNAALGEPIVWLDDSTLVVRRIPAGRSAAPVAPSVPEGPVVQENLGRRAAARTYDGLLASVHDEALFEYYATSELARVSLDGKVTPLPVRGLISSVSPSPDGQHLIVSTQHRPFSYLVPSSRFPLTIEVYSRDGVREHRVADIPLAEGTINGVRPGPRSVTWRGDVAATLSWVQSLPSGRSTASKTEGKTPERDAWFTLAAPFREKPVEQQRFEWRVGTVLWGDDSFALVTETWTATATSRMWKVAPGQPGGAKVKVYERKTEDRYGDPGRVVTGRDARGRTVVQRSADRTKIYLSGEGASPEGDRPFLDEWNLATLQKRRLWRSAPPHYEAFVAFTDASLSRTLVMRESPAEPANYAVRELSTGRLTPLTAFPNPYPAFADVRSELVRYQRADGVALSGTLYLPPGWTPAKGPLPTLLWAYPREFLEAETASQVKATPERFTRVSASGPLPFLLAGYAVLNDPAMPIIAKKGQKANDTYLEQLVANAQAAVDELVRRGVADPGRIAIGGHSYGAFMTANLLAHTRLFRAGIARSGAYNRTLTPFGFQREQRSLWDAPQVYAAMSPFNFAHQVKDPLLLIHGAADNNPGTFPIQSDRFYNALKGHGATTRLVMLPHEAHGYRARESLLHMLWEMETWLDVHVKSAAESKPKAAE